MQSIKYKSKITKTKISMIQFPYAKKIQDCNDSPKMITHWLLPNCVEEGLCA